MTAPAPDVANVTFTTTEGPFTIEIHREWAPVSADRFYNLARLGYYSGGDQSWAEGEGKGSAFYRAVKTWVVQFGPSFTPPLSVIYANNNCMDVGFPPCHVDGACIYPDPDFSAGAPVKAPNKRGYVAISNEFYSSVCGDSKCPCIDTPEFCKDKPVNPDQLIGGSEVFVPLMRHNLYRMQAIV